MKLFNITLELLIETDIFEELFIFFRIYMEKKMKVRLLILAYAFPSNFHS